jgi:hypothetical protein
MKQLSILASLLLSSVCSAQLAPNLPKGPWALYQVTAEAAFFYSPKSVDLVYDDALLITLVKPDKPIDSQGKRAFYLTHLIRISCKKREILVATVAFHGEDGSEFAKMSLPPDSARKIEPGSADHSLAVIVCNPPRRIK